MTTERPVVCADCGITWSSHHDFHNHIAAAERLRAHLAGKVRAFGEQHHHHVEGYAEPCDLARGDRCDITAAYRVAASMIEGAS